MGRRTALSIEKDFDPAESVNDLSSTLVRLYRARLPFAQCEIVSQQYGGVWLDASDQ